MILTWGLSKIGDNRIALIPIGLAASHETIARSSTHRGSIRPVEGGRCCRQLDSGSGSNSSSNDELLQDMKQEARVIVQVLSIAQNTISFLQFE